MIIGANGIRIEANVQGNVLTYRVVEQTKRATDTLNYLGEIVDEDTGLRLRSNKRPSFNKTTGKFFIRGIEKTRDNDPVEVAFKSAAKAKEAVEALERLVGGVQLPPGIVPANHNDIAAPEPGGTTAVRFALITKDQANKLCLTGKKFYPEERYWKPARPIRTINKHYNEHIGQVVDVLNKASKKNDTSLSENQVVNPHRATTKGSRQAVEAVRDLFDRAEQNGYLVELWRVVTGIRGPDFEDEPNTQPVERTR
jgi:hypothetical protein